MFARLAPSARVALFRCVPHARAVQRSSRRAWLLITILHRCQVQARAISASQLCCCDAAAAPEATSASPKVKAIVDQIETLNQAEVADLYEHLKTTLNLKI